jgi:hypothetical protein
MTARAAVWQLISGDTTLNALGIVQANTYTTNSVDNPETKPFVIIRFETVTAAFGQIGAQNMSIWAHDERGDYSRIDQILQRIQDILTNAVHVAGNDGFTLSSSRYQGTSDDLWDDGYRTITRYSTFSVLSRAS